MENLSDILSIFTRPPRKDEVSGCPVSSWDRGLYVLRGHFWDCAPKIMRALRGSKAAIRALVHGNQGKGGLPRLKREAGLVPAPLRPYHRALCKALEQAGKAKSDKARNRALEQAAQAVLEAFRVSLGDPAFGPERTKAQETQETNG